MSLSTGLFYVSLSCFILGSVACLVSCLFAVFLAQKSINGTHSRTKIIVLVVVGLLPLLVFVILSLVSFITGLSVSDTNQKLYAWGSFGFFVVVVFYSLLCLLCIFCGTRCRPPPSQHTPECRYVLACREFVTDPNGVALPNGFLNRLTTSCWCDSCRSAALSQVQGSATSSSVIIQTKKRADEWRGWVRFGLRTSLAQLRQRELEDGVEWDIGYHGTTASNTLAVILNGLSLLKPGDETADGVEIAIQPEHIQSTGGRDVATDEFVSRVFASPSLKMCSLPFYAAPKAFKGHNFKCVFLLKCRPGSYEVGPHTLPIEGDIDPRYDNAKLEWSTRRNSVFCIIGLMVKRLKIGSGSSIGVGSTAADAKSWVKLDAGVLQSADLDQERSEGHLEPQKLQNLNLDRANGGSSDVRLDPQKLQTLNLDRPTDGGSSDVDLDPQKLQKLNLDRPDGDVDLASEGQSECQ